MMVRPPGSGGGRLADLASEAAVLAEAEPALRNGDDEIALTRQARFEPAAPARREGDARCAALLAAAGEALGFAIANLISLFAPPKVMISGGLMASERTFRRAAAPTVAALLPPSLADVSDIVTREWSDGFWVRGAAAMTLRDLYGAPWGTTGPAPTRETPRISEDSL